MMIWATMSSCFEGNLFEMIGGSLALIRLGNERRFDGTNDDTA